jgi:hypothetical protein
MIGEAEPIRRPTMQQHHLIHDAIARDHIDLLRRDAKQARLAAKRRRSGRLSRRSR